MKKIYKIFFCFSLALLLGLIRLPAPAFAFTSLNGCLQNAQCAADIGLAKGAAATASPTMNLPFLTPSAASIPAIAALAYIGYEGYKALQDKAMSDASQPVCTQFGIFNNGVRTDNGAYPIGVINSIFPAINSPSSLAAGNNYTYSGLPDSCSTPSPTIPDAVNALSPADIVAAATSAAIAFANSPSNSDDAKMAAALAAVAAAGLLPSSTANDALKAAAAAALAAATAAKAASDAARAQHDADKAEADKLEKPADLPKKDFKVSTNFLSYFLTAMVNKFPLDIIFGATNATAPLCPSYTFFYYKYEMCFLLPLFTTIRWITFIGLSTKAIMEL